MTRPSAVITETIPEDVGQGSETSKPEQEVRNLQNLSSSNMTGSSSPVQG